MSDEVDVGSEIDALFDKVDKLPPELQMVSENMAFENLYHQE